MSIRDDYLPELVDARNALARLGETDSRHVKFKTADFGGTRTEADTLLILRYRDDDYAAYVADLKKRNPSATPVSKAAFRPINAYGTSKHNFGGAFDAEPTMIDGIAINKSPTPASIWRTDAKRAAQLYQAAHDVLDRYASKAGLVAGDSFTNPDEPHFELPLKIDELKARWTLYKNPPIGSSGGSSGLPAPGGSSTSSDGSSGQPGGNSSLLILGTLGAVAVGLIVVRLVRGQ